MAAKDALLITTSAKTLASRIVQAANQLRTVKSDINDLSNTLAHMNDGADYTLIATATGLSTTDAATLTSLLTTLQTQINGSSAVTDFTSKVLTAN